MAPSQSRSGHTGITVLACSRETSRRVGPLAWVILEELALRAQGGSDASIETNVRALASELGVGKDTVAQALARLVNLGLVRCQPQRRGGRYAGSAYELDIETCRHFGVVLNGLTNKEIDVLAPPCPVPADPAQSDAIAPDRVAPAPAGPTAPAPAQPRPLPQPGAQSLFDLSDEPSPSLPDQPNDAPSLTPRSPIVSPSSPVPQTTLPATLPPSLPRSDQLDALAPGVRRGRVNVPGKGAGERSALNGNLNGEAGSGC